MNDVARHALIARILKTALDAGYGEYVLPNRREATAWRHTAYRYRRVLAAEIGATPFDNMILSLVDREAGCAVVIRNHGGTLIINGAPVDLTAPDPEAQALLDELGLDDIG